MVRILYPVSDEPPSRVRLEGDRFHHLVHVLRVRPGDSIEIFDGRGRSFPARVEGVEQSSAEIVLGSPVGSTNARHITLVQALPKADKMEFVLQKGTELGASVFAPVETARSVVKVRLAKAEQRVQRWQRIAEEAARQCGRSDIPMVLPILALLERVRVLAQDTRTFVLDEQERSLSLRQAFSSKMVDQSPIALVVGPEGGFERQEIEALSALGAHAVTLGKNTLRTDTAALAALAVILFLDGRLG